ncbi:MAG: CDP-diacylglycerol--serine O-phosphatidyltransferase [Nanoarchaeota archaeon]|nr:CDP-diacylglycerol--serine O-phosphatidyltransferase [Nanoarchaeota archaeon]MBU1004606.1 CDP-diacylglycerol--serine O-phosphatidyltransferase [Nanoarchaeota archaeon]MBU1945530.1 CDP-diacylglycerol--serine O-phosphatidyltransferase [Nanoarchaeota archaeon]
MSKNNFVNKLGKRRLTLLMLRLLLPFIVSLLIYASRKELAVYLFILTAFVSFFDGLLAKRNNKSNQLRSILDPFADKLFVNLAAFVLFYKGMFPFWAMIVFLAKDAFVIIGALFVLIKNAKVVFKTNVIDKVSVFIQLFTLFVFLIGKPDYVLLWFSILLLSVSFIVTLFRSGVRVVKYKTDLEEIRFTRLVKLPDLVTFFNMFMGLLSVLFTIKGEYYLAIAAMFLAVVFDYFDGKVARWTKRHGDFGKQLDSLSDTISFGVAPAVLGFTLVKTNVAVIVFALFLFAGVLRLARYNIMEFSNGEFAGMPITVNGVIIPLIYLCHVPYFVYPYIYLLLAILMISPLKFKKMF